MEWFEWSRRRLGGWFTLTVPVASAFRYWSAPRSAQLPVQGLWIHKTLCLAWAQGITAGIPTASPTPTTNVLFLLMIQHWQFTEDLYLMFPINEPNPSDRLDMSKLDEALKIQATPTNPESTPILDNSRKYGPSLRYEVPLPRSNHHHVKGTRWAAAPPAKLPFPWHSRLAAENHNLRLACVAFPPNLSSSSNTCKVAFPPHGPFPSFVPSPHQWPHPTHPGNGWLHPDIINALSSPSSRTSSKPLVHFSLHHSQGMTFNINHCSPRKACILKPATAERYTAGAQAYGLEGGVALHTRSCSGLHCLAFALLASCNFSQPACA